MPKELSYKEVRWVCDPAVFHCDSTKELTPLAGIIGQDRALSALEFGLNIGNPGFNIYVSGIPGTGRTTTIRSFLEELAAKKAPPSDWCYVYNFKDAYSPNALKLPSGIGNKFKDDMKRTIEDVGKRISQSFSSKEYGDKRDETTQELNRKREASFKTVSEKAREAGFSIQQSPVGLAFVLAPGGQPITPEQYEQLSSKQKEEVRKRQETLNRLFRDEMIKLRREETDTEKKLEDLNKQVAEYAISFLFEEINKKYGQYEEISSHLNELKKDITENLELFIQPEPAEATAGDPLAAMRGAARTQAMRRYEVNVLVDNSQLKGAPVITELNPTFTNLFGRMEKEAQFGTFSTDFTLIKPGSFHKANGGYLVLRILDVLTNLQSWEGMKRALREKKLAIEEVAERLGYLSVKTLTPEPIPLDIKVVLIGDPMLYYLLYAREPEFKELFKVKADFDIQMDKTEKNLKDYAAVICRVTQEEKLRHMKSAALARIIEYSVRLAGEQDKLSALFASTADIIREANFWAGTDKSEFVEAKHVTQAIEKKVYRSNLIQEKINDYIARGIIMIDTEGSRAGTLNGLSVADFGDFAFGRPSRITASIGIGRDGVMDIEREAKMAGPIYTKGVLILGGYLIGKYAEHMPISLSARLVFEQSYEGIEGDSASSAETYALLSRLADAPLKQFIAVTGSVNQLGDVQAIGGVNEKIEGYFEVCRLKGLTGKQGVCIPESNVSNLMLKEEVVQAIKNGKFHIYPVKTIDEGIAVLTGKPAGKTLKDGSFETGSFNDRVQKRLQSQSDTLRRFSRDGEALSPGLVRTKERESEKEEP